MAHGAAVWLPFVQAFGTVLLGIGAFGLAYRQWLTANEKLRLDLYDKRDRVLDQAIGDYLAIFRDGVQAQREMRNLHTSLLKLETVFQAEALDISREIRPFLTKMIGLRKDKYDNDDTHDNFQSVVDLMPKLQEAALLEMKVFVPSPPWIPIVTGWLGGRAVESGKTLPP